MDRGRHAEAVPDFTRAIALGAHRTFLLPWRVKRGICLAAGGDLEGALEDFDVAVRADPGNGDYLFNRGWAFFRLGKREEARRDLEEAMRRNPAVEAKARGILKLLEE